ncbi:MAG: alpha/beta hydrolase [Planctomycetota bacterium]
MIRGWKLWALPVAVALPLAMAIVASRTVAPWGKEAILHSWRRPAPSPPSIPHEDLTLRGEGIDLRGWRFPASGVRRGLVVYLHGSSDDRRGSVGIARQFTPRGFDVLAYDLRAHGQSGGDACTYGVLERRDLARILDGEPSGPVTLIGFSLGASVALQAAADDPRISLVVAIAPFSDLRTIVHDRSPFFVTRGQAEEALRLAGLEGGFAVDEASPVACAARIRCPVLLVHGAEDTATPPDHSRRIFDALTCPKELLLESSVGHEDPLGAEAWKRIEEAVETLALPPPR